MLTVSPKPGKRSAGMQREHSIRRHVVERACPLKLRVMLLSPPLSSSWSTCSSSSSPAEFMMKSGVEVPFRRCPKGGNPAFLDDQSQKGPLKVKSWVPVPILIPVNRGANPGFFPIGPGRENTRDFAPIPIWPNRDRENPGHFPGQIGAGRGGIRGFGGLYPSHHVPMTLSTLRVIPTRNLVRVQIMSRTPFRGEKILEALSPIK